MTAQLHQTVRDSRYAKDIARALAAAAIGRLSPPERASRPLAGQVAIVTGSARGSGRAIALELGRAGLGARGILGEQRLPGLDRLRQRAEKGAA